MYSQSRYICRRSSAARWFHAESCKSQQHASPADIATRFLTKFKTSVPETRTQLLDANQLQLLSLTLHRPNLFHNTPIDTSAPKPGTPLPPGYHLAYFTVPILEHDLGNDGSDRSYNPEPPFTRRMWAGGSVHWPGMAAGNFLRVGEEVIERTKVLSCEAKVVKRTGEAMLVVGVEKEFETKDGIAVIDRRDWVFREALDPNNLPTPTPRKQLLSESELPKESRSLSVREMVQSPVTLFRFSALTFNGHKIHYSVPWCQKVEGHRDVVVHAPMNLINMLDIWRDIRGNIEGDFPDQINYRATSPLYAGEPYRMLLEKGNDRGTSQCEIKSDDGTTCLRGSIKAH